MTLTIGHSFTSTKTDAPDAGTTGRIQPSHWNASHSLSGTLPITNGGTNSTSADDANLALYNNMTLTVTSLEKFQYMMMYDGDRGVAEKVYAIEMETVAAAFNADAFSQSLAAMPLKKAYSAKTSAYTITDNDGTVAANAASGAVTITLPTAVGRTGAVFVIIKIDSSANVVTLATTSGQTINGSTTQVTSTQYAVFRVVSTGAAWLLI